MEVLSTLSNRGHTIVQRVSRLVGKTEKMKLKKSGSNIENSEPAMSAQQKELRQYSRTQLLEVILLQTIENDALKEKIEHLKTELSNRMLKIDRAGNIADAALELNGVFKAAEEAVSQYKENIKRMSEDNEAVANAIIKQAEEKAKLIIADAEAKAQSLAAGAGKARGKPDSPVHLQADSTKCEEVYNRNQGIRDAANTTDGGRQ